MKKKLFIGLVGIGIVFGGAFVVGATEDQKGIKEGAKKVAEIISINEARDIALQAVNGKVESVELENKYDRAVYEVDIENNEGDDDVYIDAYSGEVIAVEKDDDDRVVNISSQSGHGTTDKLISKDKAVAIAEKAVDGKAVEVELDEDDGLFKYEIELITKHGEAEVEIAAATGEILEIDLDD